MNMYVQLAGDIPFIQKSFFRNFVAVIVSFIGSLFIVKPTFTNVALFSVLAGLIGGMGAGSVYTAVRVLGKRGEKGADIVFFFSAFSCLAVLPYLVRFPMFGV